MLNIECFYCFYSEFDKVYIINYDVSKVIENDINENFMLEYDNYFKENFYKKSYEDIEKFVIENFKIIHKINVKSLPIREENTYIKNFPDLSNCNEHQIINFIEKTKIDLNDIKISTSIKPLFINRKLNKYNFQNLDVLAINLFKYINNKTNIDIVIALIIFSEYQQNEIDITNFIDYYCIPNIYRCDNFIMFAVNSYVSNKNKYSLDWIEMNKDKIIWDEDLLYDVPTYHIHYGEKFLYNDLFKKEFLKRQVCSVVDPNFKETD